MDPQPGRAVRRPGTARRAGPPLRQGTHYTAVRYAERPAGAGALASIGSIGDSYINAMAESVIGLYKTECVRHDGPFRSVDDLELATLSWVHWFNASRLHSALDYATPVEHEDLYYRENDPSAAAAVGTTRPPPNPGRFTGRCRRMRRPGWLEGLRALACRLDPVRRQDVLHRELC